jgi:predicted nucleic acid-binding protein
VVSLALDSNLLAYAENVNGRVMKQQALAVIEKLPPEYTLIPAQALGELLNVLVRKARWSRADAQRAVVSWGDAFPLIETTSNVMMAALTLSADHDLGIWDSVILAAAAGAGCRLLLSEDLQEGFSWSGVTVVNPFNRKRHPLLAEILRARG